MRPMLATAPPVTAKILSDPYPPIENMLTSVAVSVVPAPETSRLVAIA